MGVVFKLLLLKGFTLATYHHKQGAKAILIS